MGLLEPAIEDRTRWWSREDLLLILLLGALLYLPGLGEIPLFDRDEPRFASAGRAMLQTGDYIVPRFNGNLRPDKPPLLYWLQSVSYYAVNTFTPAGFNEFVARLPSAVCGALTLVVVYFAAGARFGRVTGLVSALMVGSSAVFVVESRLSTADATMILFNTLAMACAWRAFEAGSIDLSSTLGEGYRRAVPRAESLSPEASHAALEPATLRPLPAVRHTPVWMALLFWLALGLGTLAKGMPIIFVPLALVTVSIVTGRLGGEVRRHAKEFFRRQNVIAALLLLIPLIALYAIKPLAPQRGWISVLWVLVCVMIALPHLPSYVYRYGGRFGNWAWWRQLRPLVGVPLLLLVTLPWFIAAWVSTKGALIETMLGTHVVKRFSTGLEGHGAPPGFYLVTVWGTFWPWSILLIPATFHVTRRLLGKTAVMIDPRPYQFLVCWIFPAWLVYELAKTKLVHYTLPLMIPIGILCADTLVQSWLRLTEVLSAKWFATAKWVWLAMWVGMAVGIAAACRIYLPSVFWPALLLAGALIAAGVASTIAWGRPAWPFVMVLGWAAALFIASTLILPGITELAVSKRVAGRVLKLQQMDPEFKFVAVGFTEDTLVFYADQAGQRVEKDPPVSPGDAPRKEPKRSEWIRSAMPSVAAQLGFERGSATATGTSLPASSPASMPAAQPGRKWVVVMEADQLAEFDRLEVRYFLLGREKGFNIAKGVPVSLVVVTNVAPPGWRGGAATESQPALPPLEKWW